MRSTDKQSGQILLITLLVLSVATTVALSLIGRVTTDQNISTQVEESSRAFSAAEAGIEQALKLGDAPSAADVSGARYTVTATAVGNASVYITPVIEKGDVATLWLVNHVNGVPDVNTQVHNSNINICWIGSSIPTSPAVEIALYYRDASDILKYKVAKMAIDPYDGRSPDNNFDNTYVACSIGGFTYQTTVNLNTLGIDSANDIMLMLRIKPLYQNTAIAASSAENFPQQGTNYTSCGSTYTNVTRCIQAISVYRAPNEIFDYVVYGSGGSLVATP